MDHLSRYLPPDRLSYFLDLAQLVVFGAAALAIVLALLFGRRVMPWPAGA